MPVPPPRRLSTPPPPALYNRLNAEPTLERDRYSLCIYADNLLGRIIEIEGPGATTNVFGVEIDHARTVGLRLAGKS